MGRRNRVEREFQPAALEIMETPASPAARAFLGLILSFVVGTLAWSWFGQVDTVATMQGKVIPIGRVQVVESLVSGTLVALHVRSGDLVRQGDVLAEIDPTEFRAERQKLTGELALAELTAERMRATIQAVERGESLVAQDIGLPDDVPAGAAELQVQQLRQSVLAFRSAQASIEADTAKAVMASVRSRETIAEMRKLVSLSGDRTVIFTELERRGVGIKSNTLNARKDEQDQVVALRSEEARLAELAATVSLLRARKVEQKEGFLDKAIAELVAAESRVATLEKDIEKVAVLEGATTLKAPVAGRVQNVQLNTIGEVVQAGQEAMIIVPADGGMEIEAMLPNKDRGFVSEGQQVRVKLEAYPFTKYGTLSGTVASVSNDALALKGADSDRTDVSNAAGELVYPVRVSLEASTGADAVDVIPGMAATVEVMTGQKRILEYFTEPLLRMKDEALHER